MRPGAEPSKPVCSVRAMISSCSAGVSGRPGPPQRLRRHHIELDVAPVQLEVRPEAPRQDVRLLPDVPPARASSSDLPCRSSSSTRMSALKIDGCPHPFSHDLRPALQERVGVLLAELQVGRRLQQPHLLDHLHHQARQLIAQSAKSTQRRDTNRRDARRLTCWPQGRRCFLAGSSADTNERSTNFDDGGLAFKVPD